MLALYLRFLSVDCVMQIALLLGDCFCLPKHCVNSLFFAPLYVVFFGVFLLLHQTCHSLSCSFLCAFLRQVGAIDAKLQLWPVSACQAHDDSHLSATAGDQDRRLDCLWYHTGRRLNSCIRC